jgi:hypothetical protein
MYAFTTDSFRYVGESGFALPGEQIAKQVPIDVLQAIERKEAIWRRDVALRSSAWALLDPSLPQDKVMEWRGYQAHLLALTDDPAFPHVDLPVEPSV